jgi:hemoglobin
MSWAFGGPAEYRGRPLREAHAKLVRDKGLSDTHFAAVAKHLEDTLNELGVEQALIAEALGIVGGVKNEVLNR